MNRKPILRTTWFLIAFASIVLAGANAWLNPNRPAWSQATLKEGEIRLADALAKEPPVLWVDARPAAEFDRGHIPGAVPLNEDEWETLLPGFLGVWEPGYRTVVYCGSAECQASAAVAGRLRDEVGLGEVFVLKGGWEVWQAHAR